MRSAGTRPARWQDQADVAGRRVGVPVLVAVTVLTLVSVALGLAITGPLDGAVGRLDRALADALVRRRSPGWTTATGVAGALANSAPVALVWVAAVAWTAWRTRRWPLPVFLLAAVGGEKLTYLATSLVVGRDRPAVPPLGHVYATNSFPSGHVAAAITLYGGLAVAIGWWRRAVQARPLPPATKVAAAAAVAAVAVAVGGSRLYRGHHYASDVAWGVVLGGTWLALAWHLALRRTDAGAGAGDGAAG